MAKRKRSSLADQPVAPSPSVVPSDVVSLASKMVPPVSVRRTSSRRTQPPPADIDTNPQHNPFIKDGDEALRASPDAEELEGGDAMSARRGKRVAPRKTPAMKIKVSDSDSSLSDLSDADAISTAVATPAKPSTQRKQTTQKVADTEMRDPEADEDEVADPEELQQAMSRPPAVNSSFLPLPWKGRLGYACLNTYLRQATPPVFTSRTCRV